jgi:hypothetical protein
VASVVLGWESPSLGSVGVQLAGFVCLVYGTLLFNDVVAPPCGHRPMRVIPVSLHGDEAASTSEDLSTGLLAADSPTSVSGSSDAKEGGYYPPALESSVKENGIMKGEWRVRPNSVANGGSVASGSTRAGSMRSAVSGRTSDNV